MVFKVPRALTSGDGWGGCVPPLQELGRLMILSIAEAAGEDARPPDQIILVYNVLRVYFPCVIL